MNDLYLRTVELSNFRVYGDAYAFELPPKPSVTLIVGANGLGKTSFFDGVEWALTGQVSRFSDIKSDARRRELDPLTRVGAPTNSHRVSLSFSDGLPIDRGGGFDPAEGAIASLLKKPHWPEISNLHGYLSITHFLGQSATRRFSLREPKSQWEALKGPAGVDRINNLRERVSGQGARQAFTRAIRDRSVLLEKASATLDDWRTLLADQARLSRLSSSERAATPRQVLTDVERLAAQVSAILPTARWTTIGSADEPEFTLNALANLIGQVTEQNAIDAARAEALDRVVDEFETTAAQAAEHSAIVSDLSARRSVLVEQLVRAEAAVAQTSTAQRQTELRAGQIHARAAQLARVASAIEQLDKARREITDSDRQLDASKLEMEKAHAALAAAQKKVEDANALRSERATLSSHLLRAERRTQLSEALRLLRIEKNRLAPLVSARDPDALRTQRAKLAAERQSQSAEIERLLVELNRHDERARSLAEAVSLIAHQLGHDDDTCPVCATTFESGRLKELASARAETDIMPAAELANRLAALRVAADSVAREAAQVERDIAEHDQLVASVAAEQAREASFIQQLVDAGGAADGHYDQSEVISLRGRLEDLDQRIADGPSQDALDAMVASAQGNIDAERVKRSNLERQKVNASAQLQTSRSLLGQYPDLWTSGTGLLVNIETEQAAAEQSSRAIGEQLRADEEALEKAMIELDQLNHALARDTATLASTNKQLDAEAARRRDLTEQWVAAGETGEPARVRVDQLRARIAERKTRLEPISAAHSDLIDGLRAWQNDQQLQEKEKAIAAVLNERAVTTPDLATLSLQADVDTAQHQLSLAQRARERMEDVGNRMQERAEQFADDVLKPLNETIQRFAQTLMTWSDASIIYRAEHHATRSELRPAILRTEPDGTTIQLEMNPNLYFSEGQLSALSVSALLAASTTFTWSRWRGLLLDDPLQHNDVIHASAFMDLLRQMVRELGYQVVLSTHDNSEAEFLVRKCRSAGIPFTIHELIPRADGGLVSAVA